MKKWIAFLALSAVLFTSCDKLKSESPNEACNRLNNTRISGDTVVAIGGTLQLSVHTQAADNDFIYTNWWGPNNFSAQDQQQVSLSNFNLPHRGWYYVRVKSRAYGCERVDSVYVNTTLPQGTAPCSQALNSYLYNNMGGSGFTYTDKTIAQAMKVLEGHSLFTDVTVQFHPYFVDREPLDGVYSISNDPYWSQTDLSASQVYVKAVVSSTFIQANNTAQKVYVSHVGGKLQVQFCNLAMSGSGLNTQLSATLREP